MNVPYYFRLIFCFIFLFEVKILASQSAKMLSSTEADPDSFIDHCVNVMNGDYCESATDLIIAGPNPLILQRYYNAKDYVTGEKPGGWRIFPQRFLIIGKDPEGKTFQDQERKFEWTYAFAGERSGGILTYSGWKNLEGVSPKTLKISVINDGIGMVNTYAKDISGQTNHQNNALYCKKDSCKIVLGDGTQRVYERVDKLPSLILGEELVPLLAAKVVQPEYWRLAKERLPSGNWLLFSYDKDGHLTSVEMKNASQTNTISWIRIAYKFLNEGAYIKIATSDEKFLEYHFALLHVADQKVYVLTNVQGSHLMPCSYQYAIKDSICYLIRKDLPEGRFRAIEYDAKGRVKILKTAHPQSGLPEPLYTFKYGKNVTTVVDALGRKTDYQFKKRLRLNAICYYDRQGQLYRVERKFWGHTTLNSGLLFARTIEDGKGCIYSYRSFTYDLRSNVIEEKLYGNLTGKQEVILQVDEEGNLINANEEECNRKTFAYSEDKFNLLVKIGDCKGNQVILHYVPNTNLLSKKFVYDQMCIKRRTVYEYNEDASCITIIEDDGAHEDPRAVTGWGVTERHITRIKPKQTLPGVGLPEVIEKKARDPKTRQEILVQKSINTYDAQGNLLICDTYDSNENFAYREQRTYDHLGLLLSETNPIGKEIHYTYDQCGNRTGVFNGEKATLYQYDLCNQLIQITEIAADLQLSSSYTYDMMGRKTSSTDFGGHRTDYEYDDFDRLVKIVHPEVQDENDHMVRPTFSYTYDLFGYVTSLTDPKGFTIYKTYNLRGQPTKVMYPDGSYELFKYDTEGSLHRSFNRDRIITVYEYDYLGRLVYSESSVIGEDGDTYFFSRRAHRYSGFRRLYDKYGYLVKHYSYDSVGRLTKMVEQADFQDEDDPEARCTEFAYDALGRMTRKKIWFDTGLEDYTVEYFDHDLLNNILEKRIEDAKGQILIRKGFTYDSEGRCLEEYGYQDGKRISFIKTTYHAFGEPTHVINASGKETKIVIDYYHQNTVGQKTLKKTLINALGVRTEMEFDGLGRLIMISKQDPMGVLLSMQKIAYDTVGNKSREIHGQIVEGKLIGSKTIYWRFGPMGRLEEEGEVNGKSSLYTYNSRGQLITKSLSSGSTFKYGYHLLGRLEQIECQGEGSNQTISHRYVYDQRGNVVQAQTLDGISIERKYNVFNQITQETIQDEYGKYDTYYTYDRKGRLTSVTLPDQSKIIYVYDALFGREVKRLSAQGDLLYSHRYNCYNEQGKLLSETLIEKAGSREYLYDLNGHKIQSKTDFLTEECQRDALERIVEVKKQASFKVDHATFSYNNLSQLISEKAQDLKTYVCDSLDNRFKVNDEALIYNALNQLVAHAKKEFAYDPQGNLIRKVLDGEETNFTSNSLSQLIAITKPDQTTQRFSYDAFGRLMTHKHQNLEKSTVSRLLYIDYQEIGSLNEKGEIEILRIPGLCGEELSLQSIAFEKKNLCLAPLHDFAGNITALIRPLMRQVFESYTYSAFGEETIYNAAGEKIKDSINPWRFAEKRKIDHFIIFGFRFYDPSTGRWLTPDPAGFADGPNPHAYLHHNPLNYLDRFGLATEDSDGGKFEDYFYGEVEPRCFCERHRTCKRGGEMDKFNHLPKITYCESFEQCYAVPGGKDFWASDEFQPYFEGSHTYDLGLPELPDMGIGFINGIDNSRTQAEECARHISKLAGGYNVHAVYNATHGFKVDLIECWMGLHYIATEPVHQLHKMWNSFFEKASSTANFLMICHSQGAIHVRNALLDYPPELRERILVVAIAPGGYIYKETCSKVVHYRASEMRDFVPRLDRAGSKREKETITDIASHPDAAWFDHSFRSPTYQIRLRQHILNYTKGQVL